jgi:hypothetical protein
LSENFIRRLNNEKRGKFMKIQRILRAGGEERKPRIYNGSLWRK